MTILNAETRIGEIRNRFNIHHHTSKNETSPISNVRVRYVPQVGKLFFTATDQYTLAETYIPVQERDEEGFEVLLDREDVVALGRAIKARSRDFTFMYDHESKMVEIEVDKVTLTFKAKSSEEYPKVDRLWPNVNDLAVEGEGNVAGVGINSTYLDRFRRMNSVTTYAIIRMLFQKKDGRLKPIVVMPTKEDTGWRGLIVPVRFNHSQEAVKSAYRGWEQE